MIGGLSDFFGGRAIHEFDRLFAQPLALGAAFVCLIGDVIRKYVIDDIEWEEATEEAAASGKQP